MAARKPKPKPKDSLKTDARNHNKGTKRGREEIRRSMKELGAGRSGLAAADGEMLAGNHALKAARELGLSVREIEVDGNEFVVLKRIDLKDGSDERAMRMKYADNLTQQHNFELDEVVLVEDIGEGLDVSGFLTEDELDKLLDADPEPQPPKSPKDPKDDPPEEGDNIVVIGLGGDEDAAEFHRLCDELADRWELLSKGSVVLTALRKAAEAK